MSENRRWRDLPPDVQFAFTQVVMASPQAQQMQIDCNFSEDETAWAVFDLQAAGLIVLRITESGHVYLKWTSPYENGALDTESIN